MANRINKARYWTAVLYPENMPDNWQDTIADTLELPFAYCIHSKDSDTKSEHRKDHVHLILVFPNTTTYAHALSVFRLLGENACPTCKAVINIRHCYDYLIHDTDTCRKASKHLYEPSERVLGNAFDIGAYEQISAAEKDEILQRICDFVIEKKITNMADFYVLFNENFGGGIYFEVLKTNNAFIDRLTRGNYLKYAKKDGHIVFANYDQKQCDGRRKTVNL